MLDLDKIREEYTRYGLTSELYRVVKQAVTAVVWARRPPSWRALDGRWDGDAITALTHDFLMEGLPGHKLFELIHTCADTAELETRLEQLVQHYIRRTSCRGVLGNLQEQVVRVLEASSEFAALSRRGRRVQWVWGLSEWLDGLPADGCAERVSEVRGLLLSFKRPQYSSKAVKRPPALSGEDLRLLLRELFARTRVPWTLQDIVSLIADTLGLADEERTVSFEASGIDSSSRDLTGEDPADYAQVRELASAFFRDCSPRERALLAACGWGPKTYGELGKKARISKSRAWSLSNELVDRLTRFCGGDAALASSVWDALVVAAVNERNENKEGYHG